MELFRKADDGEYVPVVLEKLFADPSEWENSFIVVRVGNDNYPSSTEDLDEMFYALESCEALLLVKNGSFLVTHHNVKFEKVDFKKLENK